jgi:dolichol-phosphate mannosyltransferase
MLEERGHSVEVIVPVADGVEERLNGPDAVATRSVDAERPGLTSAAVAGIEAAEGSILVLWDLGMEYSAGDVVAVVDTLVEGGAEVVVASRYLEGATSTLRRPLARAIGSTDPTSGLVGVCRHAADAALGSFATVGSRFALEVLIRLGGRRRDIPVAWVRSGRQDGSVLDDLRQLKRLADDKLGNFSRLMQFCCVGASGMVIDLTLYAVFQAIFKRTWMAGQSTPVLGGSLVLAVSGVLAIAVAVTWNFSLNRRLTFNEARRGPLLLQYARYVLSNLLGIAVNLTLRLKLPLWFAFFSHHHHSAAVVGIVTATGLSFSMARWFVFAPRRTAAADSGSAAIGASRVAPAPFSSRGIASAGLDGSRPLEEASSTHP